MSDEDSFQAALDANPNDYTTRLVFADWLQERGDVRAEGYRALGLNRRKPGSGDCPWFRRGLKRARNGGAMLLDLPPDWFDLIEIEGKSSDFAPSHEKRKDATRRQVEDAAALAFAKLPPERRAELLAGEKVGVTP